MTKDKTKEIYPATFQQQGVWLQEQIHSNNLPWIKSQNWEIHGILNVNNFKNAIQHTINIHKSLRTTFELRKDALFQKIKKEIDISKYFSFSKNSNSDNLSIRDHEIASFSEFNLFEGPLIFFNLKQIESNKFEFEIKRHHIISDITSCQIIFNDVLKHYNNLQNGIEVKTEKICNLSYTDYAIWQKEFVKTEEYKTQKKYWITQFKNGIPNLDIKPDSGYEPTENFKIGNYELSLNFDLVNELRNFGLRNRVIFTSSLVLAQYILLSKYSGQKSIVIGSISSGRHKNEFKKTSGIFANILPLMLNINPSLTIKEALLNTNLLIKEAYENQDVVFQDIQNEVGEGVTDLIKTVFNYYKFKNKGIKLHNAEIIEKINTNPYYDIAAKEILSFNFFDNTDSLKVQIRYPYNYFSSKTIKKIAYSFNKILESLLSEPTKKICDISILSKEDKQLLLSSYNDTQQSFPLEKTINQIFEEQVKLYPKNIALELNKTSITYEQLNIKSNIIAQRILKITQGRKTRVALLLEPSIELVACIIAVLKSGSAYVPLSPESPLNRNKFIINDCQVKILLTHSELKSCSYKPERIIEHGKIIHINEKDEPNESTKNLDIKSSSSDVAYIIYTSGTTGQPKGVAVKHVGVVNFIHWRKRNYKLDHKDVTLQLLSYHFDGYGSNLFTSVLTGGKLVLISDENRLNSSIIVETIQNKNVTNFVVTPGLYEVILQERIEHGFLNSLRLVVLAGEQSSLEIIKKTHKYLPHTQLSNEYGPTEASIGSVACNQMDAKNPLIIGKPIANTQIYILDEHNILMPIGATGELCISGIGLAKGYVNKKDLTQQKFIDNPYKENDRLYKTGDLARWSFDGNLEFIGRKDSQIKIRGFRVELSEIEKCINRIDGIEAKVLVEDEEERFICAYYTSTKEISENEIKDFLADYLPNYMIPTYLYKVNSFPLNSNGKIDNDALVKNKHQNFIEEPVNDIEKELVSLWSSVLNIKKSIIGRNSNFFTLGGHSLKAMSLLQKVKSVFGIEVSLNTIFQKVTIKQFADFIIDSSKKDNFNNSRKNYQFDPIPVSTEKKEYFLSPMQKRMYFLHSYNSNSIVYNIPSFIKLKGKIDIEKLTHCFEKLFRRHVIFKVAFSMNDEKLVQSIRNNTNFEIEQIHCSEGNINDKIQSFIRPFDLNNPPLIRVALLRLTEALNYLLIDMHHIVSDGISFSILFKELNSLWKNETLPELRLNYLDYSEWISRENNDYFKKQKDYWLSEYQERYKPFDLSLDYTRPTEKQYNGSIVRFNFSEKQTNSLKQLGYKNNASLYMVILSVLNVLLSKLSNQEDIVIGTPVSERVHPDTGSIIGLFINTIAIRNKPYWNLTFHSFLLNVRKKVIKSFENQEFPYEELIENIDIERDPSRNPLFDVMLMFQNFEMAELDIPNVKTLKYTPDKERIEKFDLSFIVNEEENKLNISIGYDNNIFKESTIKRYTYFLHNLVSNLIADPFQKISEINLISQVERKKILFDFNQTKTLYPDHIIIDLFKKQAELTPNRNAIIFKDTKVSYSEFNDKVKRFANYLIGQGVKKGEIIGVLGNRSIELIQSIFGILLAGAAYLPLDPKYPQKRIESILNNSNVQKVVSHSSLKIKVPEDIKILDIDIDLSGTISEAPIIESLPQDLAYVIYTSGTTGNPKGVMIEHQSVTNILFSLDSRYPLHQNDCFMFKTSIAFDVSVSELFGWFLHGGSLCILPEGDEGNSDKIIDSINKNNITHINFVPSMFQVFIKSKLATQEGKLKSVKYFLLAGEALSREVVKDYLKSGLTAKLENIYGPTESTVYSSCYSISNSFDNTIVPIGKPLDNIHLLILDSNKKIQPIGVPGELYIGGKGLAKGYLNNFELTDQKFIDYNYGNGNRLYRSGDLAKWLPDGNIEYIGRIDDQVKIRGFRIELSEIRDQLNNIEGICESVVLVFGNDEDKHIKAFFTSNKLIPIIKVKKYLRSLLPYYMMPAQIIRLKEIPLTLNGKVDRKKLEEKFSEIEPSKSINNPPTEKYEIEMARIWSKILTVDKINLNDNFFDLGGHSLATLKVKNILEEKYNIKVNVKDFFQKDLKQFSKYIEQ